MFKQILASCILTAWLFTSAAAQVVSGSMTANAETPRGKAKLTDEQKQELEKKAFELLDEAVAGARSLKLSENRVRVQVAVASLLWKRDEATARALLKEATDSINQLISSSNPEEPLYYETAQTLSMLRNEFVQVVAPHDARLALDFLRATRQPQPDYPMNPDYRGADQELGLEVNLANLIIQQDPKQALRIAEETLEKGVTSNLTGILYNLNSSDPQAARKLAGDIIKRLRNEDLLRDYEANNVAVQLIHMTQLEQPPAPASSSTSTKEEPKFRVEVGRITLDERTRKDLIETVAAAAGSSRTTQTGTTYNLTSALQSVMPEVERFAPTRVEAIKRKGVEAERNMDPRSRLWKEYQGVMQGTVEEMLEAAPKAPPEVRDQLYVQAAWKSINENHLDRAREIIEKISNPSQRAQMRKDIERQLPWRAVEQGNLDMARTLLNNVPREERTGMLIQLANSALLRGKTELARQLLDEARNIVGGRAQNQMQFYAQLDVARAYARFDQEESFKMVESAIDQVNEMIAAAAIINGFGQDSFREGELKPQGGFLWNELVVRCASELAALAPLDFERASSDVQRFQRTDARTTAQVYLAQGLLTTLKSDEQKNDSTPMKGRVIRGGISIAPVIRVGP